MKPKDTYSQTESDSCLTIMPFSQEFDSVYDAVANAVENKNVKLSHNRADKIYKSNQNSDQFLQKISHSNVIISDVSTWSEESFNEKDKVLILTQSMKEIPSKLQRFRCLEYSPTESGLRQLTKNITDTLQEIVPIANRFTVDQGDKYRFPHRIRGAKSNLFDFEINLLEVKRKCVKLEVEIFQYIEDNVCQKTFQDVFEISQGETIGLPGLSWRLELEYIRASAACLLLTSSA